MTQPRLTAAAVALAGATLASVAHADQPTVVVPQGCSLNEYTSNWEARKRADGGNVQRNGAIPLFGDIRVSTDNGTFTYLTPQTMAASGEQYVATAPSLGIQFNGGNRASAKAWGIGEDFDVNVPDDTARVLVGVTDAAGDTIQIVTDGVGSNPTVRNYTVGQPNSLGVSWIQVSTGGFLDDITVVPGNGSSLGLAGIIAHRLNVDCPHERGGNDNNPGGVKSESSLGDGPGPGGTTGLN